MTNGSVVRFFKDQDTAAIVNTLGKEVAAQSALPLRVGVLQNDGEPGELVVVGHRRFLDVASLVLLAEDIYRGRHTNKFSRAEARLLPAPRKTYTDWRPVAFPLVSSLPFQLLLKSQ